MASIPTPIASILAIALLLSLCSTGHGEEPPKFLVMNIESLETSTTCSTPEGIASTTSTTKITHAYGPCSSLGVNLTIDPIELLLQDEQRVDLLHQRLSNASHESKRSVHVQSGQSLTAEGLFVMTIGLGTPPRNQTVLLDTGSSTCWVQCTPCTDFCYVQKEPYFNPTRSTTYRHVTCPSRTCELPEFNRCNANKQCVYGEFYEDGASSGGFLSLDTLSLTATDAVPDFVFGCSENFQGSFGQAAGLFGLGRKPLSLISQTSRKYNNQFSYCLPSNTSSTGYFTFGPPHANATNASLYTPMITYQRDPTFYGITLVGISVEGKRLSLTPDVFATAGTIIDSGTTLTYLPPAAYAELRKAIRSQMTRLGYGRPLAVGVQDTCYNITGMSTVKIPTVSLSFSGGELSLGTENIVTLVNKSVACLAFAGSRAATDVSIIGNTQQKGFEISLDLGGRRIGFAGPKC